MKDFPLIRFTIISSYAVLEQCQRTKIFFFSNFEVPRWNWWFDRISTISNNSLMYIPRMIKSSGKEGSSFSNQIWMTHTHTHTHNWLGTVTSCSGTKIVSKCGKAQDSIKKFAIGKWKKAIRGKDWKSKALIFFYVFFFFLGFLVFLFGKISFSFDATHKQTKIINPSSMGEFPASRDFRCNLSGM